MILSSTFSAFSLRTPVICDSADAYRAAAVSGAGDGRDDQPEPLPPVPTWNAIPAAAAAAMTAGPCPPAPGILTPSASPGPSPQEPSEPSPSPQEPTTVPAVPKDRRVIVPAGDHLWGGRAGGVSVVAVCPWTAAVLERGQVEGPSGSHDDGQTTSDELPRRLHLVCHRGARLWGQVRWPPLPTNLVPAGSKTRNRSCIAISPPFCTWL